MAETSGRRFVTRGGLHEFDSTGRIIRSWWGESWYTGKYKDAQYIRLPADCPVHGDNMVAAGDMLVFSEVGLSPDAYTVVGWEPKTDTWYGPLGVNGVAAADASHALGNRAGVWLTMGDGMLFMSADDLRSAATKAGRMMTTAEYRRRQREAIGAMPLLNQAKLAIAMRQLDVAEKLLNRILKNDANCDEAILLLGYLHDQLSEKSVKRTAAGTSNKEERQAP
jgi:hypothetical protein